LSISINIPFELSYKSPPPTSAPFAKKVYALLVQFSANPAFETLPPLRIPYLAMPEDASLVSGFPYLYHVVLTFRPKFPLPVSFAVKILFNDGDGKTCKGETEPVSISFLDLVMEVPVPPMIKLPKQEFLRTVFDNLWQATSNSSNEDAIESVKLLEAPHVPLLKVLETELQKFLIVESAAQNGITGLDKVGEQTSEKKLDSSFVQNNDNSNNQSTDYDNSNKTMRFLDEKVYVCSRRALLFLPAKYHILMVFTIYEDHTLVKIRTDFWKALSYIDAFFNVLLEDL